MEWQLEHHLFPTMPRYRYPELVPRVRQLAAEHGIECKLQFSLKRGYPLNVPRRAPADEEALPRRKTTITEMSSR